jgi:hypothetical protein
MTDYLELGPSPCDEDCEQLGANYDPARARLECRVLRDQMIRQFGPPPEGAFYKTRSNPHDFGTYYELAIYYDEHNEVAVAYAFNVESQYPQVWDAQARQALGLTPQGWDSISA